MLFTKEVLVLVRLAKELTKTLLTPALSIKEGADIRCPLDSYEKYQLDYKPGEAAYG